MTTPDETLHLSDDERELDRLRAKVAALEVELSVQRKATGEEMGKREGMERNWNQMAQSNREHVDRAEWAEAKVRTLEHCLALSNESALQSAGRIRELQDIVRGVSHAAEEYRAELAKASETEREACARLVEETHWHPGGVEGSVNPKKIAAAIRARGGG